MERIDIHRNREEANAGNGCACGAVDEGTPELDVQTIPHPVRHSAIFGVLDGLQPGFAVIISATHDPVPLLDQLSARSPGLFDTNYLERGPERWRIVFRRKHQVDLSIVGAADEALFMWSSTAADASSSALSQHRTQRNPVFAGDDDD